MKKRRLLPVLAHGLLACADDPTAVSVPFTVRVDSVEAPTAIGPSDSLPVRLLGVVGPDGCHRLTRVRRDRTRFRFAWSSRRARPPRWS